MKVGNNDYEPFDMKELAVKIIDILNWVKIHMKKNTFKKIFLIILICIGLYGVINNLIFYSNRKNEVFTSKTLPATPMSALPLEITKDFDLYKTADDVYYYGGEIYNSGNEEIVIEELCYTFSRGVKTYMQTTIETNIRILPKSTYTLYDVPLFVVYDDKYIVDYAYVEITVNGEEQYLFHENYYSIVAEYNKLLNKENEEFEKNKEQPLKNSIGFMVFTGIMGILLIRVFIIGKSKK